MSNADRMIEELGWLDDNNKKWKLLIPVKHNFFKDKEV